MREPHSLPDLSGLAQTALLGLALAQRWEDQRYPEPTNFQLVTVARLMDKALRDYGWARTAFAEHDHMWDGVGPAIRPRPPGITIPLFRAIGHVEDLIAALDRILRLLPALAAATGSGPLSGMPLPGEADATAVRQARNRIAHGDEDIASGKPGPVATLRPDAAGIQIGSQRLNFEDLARWLREVHAFVYAAMP